MKLQLALDRITRDQCIGIIQDTEKEIDIIEVGTGVIKEYGMAIVREIRERFPDKTIFIDMKTCDAGKHEALQAFNAGADMTSVMAFSADSTIKDMLHTASQTGNRVMVDLLGVHSRDRIKELDELGVNLVSLHVGKDMQADGAFNTSLFSLLNGFDEIEVAVAGGINMDTISAVVRENPDTIIVGSAITKAENPQKAAAKMKSIIQRMNA
ncbi:3-hexulose-6-phosphate synthase [Virgibacillus siamensis]|uniref:3-hexulose-6-phosphate synthase n=1 Tax=Virgibacillus siamensis TaxID=480071 RepID=UPI0009857D8A|nr:3-hexulose-6-phosphate synthase [Virgibacillus siamensis]